MSLDLGAWDVEQRLCLNKKLKPVDWMANDAYLRAVLDVMIIKNDEVAMVLDWKTGKKRPDYLQLAICALQMFKHYEELRVVKAGFVWLVDKSISSKTYTREQIDTIWIDEIKPRIDEIEQSNNINQWPAKPSGLCNYCPAKDICEYSL